MRKINIFSLGAVFYFFSFSSFSSSWPKGRRKRKEINNSSDPHFPRSRKNTKRKRKKAHPLRGLLSFLSLRFSVCSARLPRTQAQIRFSFSLPTGLSRPSRLVVMKKKANRIQAALAKVRKRESKSPEEIALASFPYLCALTLASPLPLSLSLSPQNKKTKTLRA